ncbi:MAG: hypothetical protein RJB66_1924 [Pseudomonadota bacterium]|jgi:hypothetical protein
MGENQSSKTWFFVLSGLAVFCLGFFWPSLFTSLKPASPLAIVVSSKGTTEWISRQSIQKAKPKKSLSLSLNESLATGTDGELIVRFKKGAEIKLLPSTFITLIKKANATLIAIRRGSLEVIKEGEAGSIFVAQNGRDHTMRDYQPQQIEESLEIDSQSLSANRAVDTTDSDSAESAIPKETASKIQSESLMGSIEKANKDAQHQVRKMIADRIGAKKNHLFRCYSNLIQKQKKAHGRLDVHFVVNNQGKIKDPTIINAEIKDPKFQKCLVQIIQRTEFQPFEGQSVSTLLPLRFEKNLNTVQ